MSNSLRLHELQHTRLPCPSLSPGGCSNSCPLSQRCHPAISSFVTPFSSCLQIFPSVRDLSKESALCIRWPKYWSFNISHLNEVGWFPLRLVGLISLLFKDSQESSQAPQFESISSLALSLLYGLTLTSVHDYRKNYSLEYMNLYWQNDVSVF